MNIFLEAADILSRVTTTDKYALVVRSLIESSGENASDKRGPAKCPVCEGTGWNPTEPPPGATNPTSVPCHSCKGAGWILPYGPFCFGETTPAPSPAPLPNEVEEAMGKIENLLGGFGPNVFRDEFGRRIHYPRDTMAALAVIRAALTATIKPPLTVAPTTKVTREWLTGAIGMVAFRAFTCENHRALVDCIEQDMARLEEMLRELGIVVEVKP